MHDEVKRSAALEMLAAGRTVKETSTETGIAERTLFAWRRDDGDFVKLLNARRLEHADELRTKFGSLGELAYQCFRDALTGSKRVSTVSFKCAEAILRSMKLIGAEVESPVSENEVVELIPIGLNEKDEAVRLGPIVGLD